MFQFKKRLTLAARPSSIRRHFSGDSIPANSTPHPDNPRRPNLNRPIVRHTTTPVDMFRLLIGTSRRRFQLQDFHSGLTNATGRPNYDIVLQEELVVPTQGDFYTNKSGASFRSLSQSLYKSVDSFNPEHFNILKIPAGTPLPPELVLVHEHGIHYSLQTTEAVPLKDFNHRLTEFARNHGVFYHKDTFLKDFPAQFPV